MLTGLVGAASTEEICLSSSLSANLHQMIATFYKPLVSGKPKIIMIKPEFSSDVFAVQSWVDVFGLKDAIIEVSVEITEDASERVIA